MQFTLFTEAELGGWQLYQFKNSSWGKLHAVIPWHYLLQLLPSKTSKKGRPAYFDNAGMFAVLFLKHELGVSDEKLLAHINTNPCLQLFCGMRLGHLQQIRDTGIISRIRSYVAHHVDFTVFQTILLQHWKSDIQHPHLLKMDATCFESYIRYPTDVKLLWECCEWTYTKQLFPLRKSLGIPLGKRKERFEEQKCKYVAFSKRKRTPHRLKRKRIKSLLNLLNKGISALQALLDQHLKGNLPARFYHRLKTVKQIDQQQHYLYTHPGAKIKDRIVSLHKPYLRPIKRGKENKPTEFGAKVHMTQVGGINSIEHLSFNAFNECKRLKFSVVKHRKAFDACHQVTADNIYPTNENRRFCTQNGIFTGFVAKGRKPDKATQQLKNELNKDRATRLEGSFGNVKNHYGLAKVKARTEATEIAWIYFGVWTANAVQIAKYRAQPPPKQSATSLKSAA